MSLSNELVSSLTASSSLIRSVSPLNRLIIKAVLVLSQVNGCCSKTREHLCKNCLQRPYSPAYLTGVGINGSRSWLGEETGAAAGKSDAEETAGPWSETGAAREETWEPICSIRAPSSDMPTEKPRRTSEKSCNAASCLPILVPCEDSACRTLSDSAASMLARLFCYDWRKGWFGPRMQRQRQYGQSTVYCQQRGTQKITSGQGEDRSG